MHCPKYTKTAMQKEASFNWTIWEYVYTRPEVNSNWFEISLRPNSIISVHMSSGEVKLI